MLPGARDEGEVLNEDVGLRGYNNTLPCNGQG